MQPNKLISIIVPVYNAENTIERCINSFNIQRDDIEVLCVDDGSTDGSGVILDRIAKVSTNVRVVHQSNAGAGAARNIGISLAQGRYLMFCDSDDTYLPETLGYIVEDILAYWPDYIVFHRKTVKIDGSVQWWGKGNKRTILDKSWVDYINNIMYERRHGMGAVTKVYRKDIIDRYHVVFNQELELGEDQWFNMTYLIHVEKMIEDFRAVYQQYQTQGSLCIRKRNNFYWTNTECVSLFEKKFPQESRALQPFIDKTRFMSAERAFQRIFEGIDGDNVKSRIDMCRKILNDEELHESLTRLFSPIQSDEQKKIRLILNKKLTRYWFCYYAIPEFKNVIKKIIRWGK